MHVQMVIAFDSTRPTHVQDLLNDFMIGATRYDESVGNAASDQVSSL